MATLIHSLPKPDRASQRLGYPNVRGFQRTSQDIPSLFHLMMRMQCAGQLKRTRIRLRALFLNP